MNEIERVEVSQLTIPYRDIGMSGEMQAAAYVTHAEAALTHFWRYRPPLEDEPHFAVSKLELRLFFPLRFEDKVTLTVKIDKIGGKSLGFEVMFDKNGQAAAEVDVIWTARDPDTNEPVALPEDTRDWLYRYLR
ncbi:thioesterase family protein [Rhizobium sp. CECT 9324]|uniref:acyl-CoA thioesterase n=1 Tax=Rhizobium sp. CECT 9324 TaxID=2845820 RepID=UPI001E50943E|nr:thioesterase family protein [Rhizobium sp. CECT 9324]CAH0339802.1 hypothetical protein RHI9324_01454 [Rhizobium sp. CECT 9324]